MLNTGLDMTFAVERDGQNLTLQAAPQVMLVDQGALGKRRIGHLGLGSTRDPKDVDLRALRRRRNAWRGRASRSASSPTPRSPTSAACSPAANRSTRCPGMVGMTQITGEIAKISLWELFNLAALFSVSVGLMNLFPVPLLDGGHLMFYLVEAVSGRPVSERMQQFGMRDRHRAGRQPDDFHDGARHAAAVRARLSRAVNPRSTTPVSPAPRSPGNGVGSV